MFAFANVEAIAHAFDCTGRGVQNAAFGSNTVCDANTTGCALVAFRRNQTTVDDVSVRHGAFGTIVDADTVTSTPSVCRFLAAALNGCAKPVKDRVGHHVTSFVTDLQRDPCAAVVRAGVNRTAREVANADVFGCCVGVDGPVALIASPDDVAKVANADAFAFDLNGPAVRRNDTAAEVVERARAACASEFDTVQFACDVAKIANVRAGAVGDFDTGCDCAIGIDAAGAEVEDLRVFAIDKNGCIGVVGFDQTKVQEPGKVIVEDEGWCVVDHHTLKKAVGQCLSVADGFLGQ